MTQFLNTPVNKSLTTASSWIDIDLSCDIPVNATGAIFQVVKSTANDASYGLRKNGSSDNRVHHVWSNGHCFAFVGVDGTRKCEGYIENTDVDFYLVGYTESDVTLFTNAYDKSLTQTGSFQDMDLSAELPAGAVAAIFEVVNTGTIFGRNFQLRKKGSTDDRAGYIGPYDHFTFIAGVDSNRVCQGEISNTQVDFYLLGYLSDGQAETNSIDRSLGSTGSYVDIDESANAPAGATGVFVDMISSGEHNYAVRKDGSSFEMYKDSKKHSAVFSGLTNDKWEGKIENLGLDFFTMGYFVAGYEEKTKESSIGLSIQETNTKESSIGMYVQGEMEWLTGYEYRKKCPITATTAGAQENYQLTLKVGENSSVAGKDIDCGSHCQDFPNDIRFTKEFGKTKHDYGVQSVTGSAPNRLATIVIEVISIPASGTVDFYMYYGKTNDVGESNDDNTFELCDDFEGGDCDWSPYANNPILSPEGSENRTAWGSTWKDGVTYHIFYSYHDSTNKLQIGHATSNDGKSWTKDTANNPILVKGPSFWDDGQVWDPAVWKEGSTWYMLYTGRDTFNNSEAVGLATAVNPGGPWTKEPLNPVLEGTAGEWDENSAENMNLIKIGDTYYLWYNTLLGAGINRKSGLATSTNLTTWIKDENNPIFGDTGGYFQAAPFKYGIYYYLAIMHYTSGTDYSEMQLYRDTNPTFYSGNRELIRICKKCSTSGWDSHDQDTPCILTTDINRDNFPSSELWMYYSGEEAGVWKTGLLIEPNIATALGSCNSYSFSDKWSVVGTPEKDNSHVYSGETSAKVINSEYLSKDWGTNKQWHVSVWFYNTNEANVGHWISVLNNIGNRDAVLFNKLLSNNFLYIINGGSDIDTSIPATIGWHHFEIKADGTDIKLYIDDALVGTDSGHGFFTKIEFLGDVWGTATDPSWFDSLRVTKYALPEPTWGTWGSEETENIKESSIGMYVQGANIKESSIALAIRETFTKESSIALAIRETFTKESSIGMYVQGANIKESSIALAIQETFTKESSISMAIVEQQTKESSIGMYVQGANIKESSIALAIQETFTKESSISMAIVEQQTKESSINMAIAVRETKESSIGMYVQGANIKESSIALAIQETFTKESSINMAIQETFTKESSIGITPIEPILKRGFFYAVLGTDILEGPIDPNFRISKQIKQTPSFEFEIANCDGNRDKINAAGGIDKDFKIYWQHHGVNTLWFTGIINADGIEYISLDSIRISGFASYVKLNWPLFKHLAAEDAEPVDKVFSYTGSYTDYTTAANNATINDVGCSMGVINHALYFGDNQPFWGAQIKYSTKGVRTGEGEVTLEYSKGSGVWGTLDALDESDSFTKAPGTYHLIIPHPPSDWERNTVNGKKKYWIRYRVTSTGYTTNPQLDQIHLVNVDVYRAYYFDTPANEILADVLAGTEYEEDLTDTCPTDIISIVAEYESPLRLIAAIPNALTWTDTEDGNKKKAYQWWIDDAKKVHMKTKRGETFSEDITGEMTIFNNKEDYFHLTNRFIGLGPRDGLSQIRAIVEDKESIETYGLRELAVSEAQIGKYLMLKNQLEKKIAISKDPMQRIRGSVSTQFWGRKEYEVGDTVWLHQPKWHVSEKKFQIVKVDIGPSTTTLDLGISQDHLEGLRDDMQRQLNLNNVRMHGSTTLLEAGPETMNYQRVDAETVYPAKLEIEIPPTAKKIHKVLLSWTLGPYRADVAPNSGTLPTHDHGEYAGNGGAYDSFDAGIGGANTPTVEDGGAFTPAMTAGEHKHLVATDIVIEYNTIDVGVCFDPNQYPDAAKVFGTKHRHIKGSTGGPDDVSNGLNTSVSWQVCDACEAYIVSEFGETSFAEGSHFHLNNEEAFKYTNYEEPAMNIALLPGALITSLETYTFSKMSNDEGPEGAPEAHVHTGVPELDHGHTGVAQLGHSDHSIPLSLGHSDHSIAPDTGGTVPIEYGIHEEPGGTDMELLINGESVGIYSTAPQSGIRIDGWLNSGNNTVALQPKVGEIDKKGGATLKATGLLFVEPTQF